MKYAFFDIDGTLSIPFYDVNGTIKCGGEDDWWKERNDIDDNVYHLCKSPKKVKIFLDNLIKNDIKCFVLSTETLEKAKQSKIKFINEKYTGIFTDIFFVEKDVEKIDFLLNFAKENNTEESDIYYLDDTFSLCIKASNKNIDAHHISEFLEY